MKKKIYSALIGIGLVSLTLGIWGGVTMYKNRQATELIIQARNEERQKAEAESQTAAEEEIGIAPGQKEELTADPRDLNLVPILAQDQLTYKGQNYRRNQYVKAILCMGVDRRDTMTEIPITNKERTLHDTKITQLTMAYAYGDGREGSCENMVESVQKLLCGFTIDQYMAVDTTVVAQLNDAVGGVTVTIPTDGMEKKDPAFVKGNQVTLHGKQAEAFVRYRDTDYHFTALYRMDQQQEYITQYFQAVKAASKTDSQIVVHLFDMIQDYMVTDMTKDQYVKIAMDGMEAGSLTNEDFYTVPGVEEITEKYDVYRADRQAAIQIILDLFYRETE